MYQNTQLIGQYNGNHKETAQRVIHTGNGSKRTKVRMFVRMSGAGLFIAILVLVYGLLAGGLGDRDAFAASEHAAASNYVIVAQGDTLWAIASEHKRKGQDVRDYVDEILKVNGLKSPSLRVGQKLLLP